MLSTCYVLTASSQHQATSTADGSAAPRAASRCNKGHMAAEADDAPHSHEATPKNNSPHARTAQRKERLCTHI